MLKEITPQEPQRADEQHSAEGPSPKTVRTVGKRAHGKAHHHAVISPVSTGVTTANSGGIRMKP